MNQSTKGRSGISLLEVILAISILVGSAAVLGQLISIGRMQAEKATELTEAQALCNNKMNELLSGIEPIEPVELQPVSLESPWDYSIQLEPGFANNLLELTVTVQLHSDQLTTISAQPSADNEPDDTTGDTMAPTNTSFRLTRWIRTDDYEIDPTLLPESDLDDNSSIGRSRGVR